jgi:tripartite-type tricarboxylate transporter receptor subunit TctC
MNEWVRCLGIAVLLAAAPLQAVAQQAYPNKPVRILVPIAAGSVTDVVMRAAALELSPRLGQPVLIENRPGASGIIGAEACARAAPDGYTACAVYHATMSFNPLLFEKLPYDPQKDLVPVTNLYFVIEALMAPAALPANSVAELKALAIARPGALNFGTLGSGSLQELLVAWLNDQWKVSIAGIPYKGGGPIAAALAANEIQLGQMGIGNFLGQIQAGQVKALAVNGNKRSPLLPAVPTAAEAGIGGFPSRPWWGLAVPSGTPREAIARLNAEFVRLFREPKFMEFLEARATEPVPGTPEEFAAFLKADREGAAALVRLAKVPRQ